MSCNLLNPDGSGATVPLPPATVAASGGAGAAPLMYAASGATATPECPTPTKPGVNWWLLALVGFVGYHFGRRR